MPLTTDNTLAFTTSTGYTTSSANVEFASGTGRLVAAYVGTGWIKTPVLNTTAWGPVHAVTVTATETCDPTFTYTDPNATSRSYYHRFLVSFNGGTVWHTYSSLGWEVVLAADIESRGMTWQTLEAIRDWSKVTTQLSFMIFMEREHASAGNGNIDLISIDHGTTETAFALESGSSTFDLLFELDGTLYGGRAGGIVPDYPNEETFEQHTIGMRMSSGHEVVLRTTTFDRRNFKRKWSGRNTAEKEAIVAALVAHLDNPFFDATTFALVYPSEPEFEEVAPGVWDITSLFTEVVE